MHTTTFAERARAMENAFFHDVDSKLLENIRSALNQEQAKCRLSSASGISHEHLLDELVAIGVQPETLAAVTLIPLVAVAWADQKVDANERERILAAEKDAGIQLDSASHRLLAHWLDVNPGDQLFSTWQDYVLVLREQLSPKVTKAFDEHLYERAEAIAKSSGGYFTYGSISPTEQRLLNQIKQTLRSITH